MLSMAGKVAIVTGAGSVGPGWGNGKATATLLARQGAKVFLVDINPGAVAETRGIIEGEGGTCATHSCDVMQSADVQEMVQACLNRFKRIDVLVNNVGGSAPGDAVSMTEEVWDRQIDFNLKTAFLGCKHVIPVMLEQGKGAIVNIASVAGMRNDFASGRSHVGYSASKAGVIQLSRSTAGTYAKKKIRVNTVVPGLMHTPSGGGPACQDGGGQRRPEADRRAKCGGSDGPHGHWVGCRSCGAVPGIGRGGLCHRHRNHRGWRPDHVHALTALQDASVA